MISCQLCGEEVTEDSDVDFLNDVVVHSDCLPNLREGSDGQLIIDLRDSLSPEEEMEKLSEITEIVEESESLEKAQEEVDKRFSS